MICPSCSVEVALHADGKEFPQHAGADGQPCKGSGVACAVPARADSAPRVRRYDRFELAKPEQTSEGFLRLEGKFSRCGLQQYEDASGKTHVELRIPEEVFADKAMRSMQMAPVTNTHPSTLLDPVTVKQHAVGSVGENIRQDGDWVVGPLRVNSADAIASLRGGRVELSVGYSCELDPAQDPALVAKWGAYDFLQRDITVNHLAIVDSARAGKEARVRLDSGDARMVDSETSQQPTGTETRMPAQIKIDGQTFNADDANAPNIQTAIDRATAAGKEKLDAADKKYAILFDNSKRVLAALKTRKADFDAMKARMMSCDECGGSGGIAATDGKPAKCEYCDGSGKFRMHDKFGDVVEKGDSLDSTESEMDAEDLKAEPAEENEASKAHSDRKRADAAKRQTEDSAAAKKAREDSFVRRTQRAALSRAQLEGEARKHLDAGVDLSPLSALDIQRKVVEKLAPQAKLDGKSAEQIKARYEAETERAAEQRAGGSGGGSLLSFVPAPRADASSGANFELPDPDAARAAMIKRNQDAAKGGAAK